MKKLSLVQIKANEKVKILEILGGSNLESKLLSMGVYKGKPVLIIKRDENDKYPFAFGLNKAKMILENLEEIRRFVGDNSKDEEA